MGIEEEYNAIIRVGADLHEELFNEMKNKGLQPEFRSIQELDVIASREKKEPVFYAQDVCLIHSSADPNARAVHLVDDDIIRRFPREYADWVQNKNGMSPRGELLSHWKLFPQENLVVYDAFGIKTVEMLAEISEAMMSKLPDGRAMRAKAETYLKQKVEVDREAKYAMENAELRERLSALEAMLAEKPKRGRPPKDEAEPHKADEAA